MTTACPACGHVLTPAPRPLTEAQADIVRLIQDSIGKRGCAPSFAELADILGYRSLSTVHEHLTNLERKGWIRRRHNEARAIELLHRLTLTEG